MDKPLHQKRHASQPFIIVACLIERDGRFLLIHEDGKWNQPAGWLELGERIIDGAKREAEEETGLEVKINNLLGVYTLIKHRENLILHAVKFVFRASPTGKEVSAEGVMPSNWFTPEEIRGIRDQLWDADVVKEVEDAVAGTSFDLPAVSNFLEVG